MQSSNDQSAIIFRVLVRIRFDGALSVWSACTVNIGAVCIPLGLRMGWGDDDSWISLVLDRRKQSRLNVSLISLWSFVHAGWVPSIHWGPSTIREVFLVHVVQPTSRQEALLQEARKTDESRRGTSVQGGASGEWIFHFPLFVSSWYNGREVVSRRHVWLDRRYIFQRIEFYISNPIIIES